jgi:hypothetical protein
VVFEIIGCDTRTPVNDISKLELERLRIAAFVADPCKIMVELISLIGLSPLDNVTPALFVKRSPSGRDGYQEYRMFVLEYIPPDPV